VLSGPWSRGFRAPPAWCQPIPGSRNSQMCNTDLFKSRVPIFSFRFFLGDKTHGEAHVAPSIDWKYCDMTFSWGVPAASWMHTPARALLVGSCSSFFPWITVHLSLWNHYLCPTQDIKYQDLGIFWDMLTINLQCLINTQAQQFPWLLLFWNIWPHTSLKNHF
jgi:hypothetical protein